MIFFLNSQKTDWHFTVKHTTAPYSGFFFAIKILINKKDKKDDKKGKREKIKLLIFAISWLRQKKITPSG